MGTPLGQEGHEEPPSALTASARDSTLCFCSVSLAENSLCAAPAKGLGCDRVTGAGTLMSSNKAAETWAGAGLCSHLSQTQAISRGGVGYKGEVTNVKYILGEVQRRRCEEDGPDVRVGGGEATGSS